MKRSITSRLIVICVAMMLLITFTACPKPPKLSLPYPPIESMQMNLSFFHNRTVNRLAKTPVNPSNFIAASARVFMISAVIGAASTVPSAILVFATTQDPELKIVGNDSIYHWSFTVQLGGNQYGANIVRTKDDSISWKVRVTCPLPSCAPPLNDFLWYEGMSNADNNEGWWRFYLTQYPDWQFEALKIDWQVPDTNDIELVFSSVAANPDSGYALTYSKSVNGFDLSLFSASEARTDTIHWNEDGSGYIKWADYNNGIKSCWDKNRENTEVCPRDQPKDQE